MWKAFYILFLVCGWAIVMLYMKFGLNKLACMAIGAVLPFGLQTLAVCALLYALTKAYLESLAEEKKLKAARIDSPPTEPSCPDETPNPA